MNSEKQSQSDISHQPPTPTRGGIKKGIKKAITLGVALVLVAGMVGLLMWQRGREEPVIYDEEPPQSQVIRIVEREENEVVKIVFQGQDLEDTLTMIPFTNEAGHTEWTVYGYNYLFDLASTRHKARSSFNLFTQQIIYEDLRDAPDINLDYFGFSQMIITSHYEDGTTLNLYLGGPTADFRGHFLMVEGDPGLYVISMLNAERLQFGVSEMLDTTLPFWDAETIDYFLVAERDRDVIEFARLPHPDMPEVEIVTMVQPFDGREVHISNLMQHVMDDFTFFGFGDMVNLHPESLAQYGLDDPSLEFIYQAEHGMAHLLFGDTFFREFHGEEIEFIYVKFADRPHVFETPFILAQPLFNMNVLRFIDRLIALIDIRYVYRVDVLSPEIDLEIYINTQEDERTIEPTINSIPVEERPFRVAYRQLIGLGIDAEIEPFAPTGDPAYTLRYVLLDDDDKVLTFYEYDGNFLAVSVDGEDIWFVTNRRHFREFFLQVQALKG